jgi:Flp pilus assembly protein TadD
MTSARKVFARIAWMGLLSTAIAVYAPIAAADITETNPTLATEDSDYAAGKKAVEKKNWPEAVRNFQRSAARDPNQADLQNYLGYSYRNLKQYDLAFKHYKRAIELDPKHRGAHEYIGEAYLMTGDLASAQKHLAALKGICGSCEEMKDLEQAIAQYKPK